MHAYRAEMPLSTHGVQLLSGESPAFPPLRPGLTGEWLGREDVKHVRTWGRGPLSSPQPFCLSQRPLTDLLCSVHLNSLARRTVQARHLGGG